MTRRTLAAWGVVALLFGCGGGGGDGGPVPDPAGATYNMDAAFTRMLTTGARFDGLKGSFAGTAIDATMSFTPAADGPFRGQTYKRAIQATTVSAAGVQSSTSQTMYFTVAPVQIVAAADQAGPLTVFAAEGSLPTAGTAGQSGPYALATSYEGTGSSTAIGQTRVAWELQPDTDSTVWACLTMTLVGAPLSEQDCFRLDSAGNVSAARSTMVVDGQTIVFSQ